VIYGSCMVKRMSGMCSKPSPKMRLVMWLIVCLTAALLFGLLRHEAKVRESQLCGVADANVRATTPPPICLKYRSN
jgi:hypothetical protein